MYFRHNVVMPPNAPGCNWKGKCTNAEKCYCTQLNDNDFLYVCQDGGRWDLYLLFDINDTSVLSLFLQSLVKFLMYLFEIYLSLSYEWALFVYLEYFLVFWHFHSQISWTKGCCDRMWSKMWLWTYLPQEYISEGNEVLPWGDVAGIE